MTGAGGNTPTGSASTLRPLPACCLRDLDCRGAPVEGSGRLPGTDHPSAANSIPRSADRSIGSSESRASGPLSIAEFDPGEHHGALGPAFLVGTHDPEGRFDAKERRIADRLAADGGCVHPRRRDDTAYRVTNPDAMVRTGPADPGTITEFKTLTEANSTAVRRNILEAGRQVTPHGGGQVVIDGRSVELTEADARRGYARAVGQARATGQSLPNTVRFLLADSAVISLPEG